MAKHLIGVYSSLSLDLAEKLIDKAKEKLSATELSVSEIAYDLGFEHPQSFSTFFKKRTHMAPLEFREKIKNN